LPPALSPATAIFDASPPNDCAFAIAQRYAANASSCAAGNLFSGPLRYSTEMTIAFAAFVSARADES